MENKNKPKEHSKSWIEYSISKPAFSHLKLFLDNYEKEFHLDGSKKIILGEKLNICRFCNRSNPTFKKEAHVMPQLLNGAKPISLFECDDCNKGFSVFESDLGEFCLLDRVLWGLRKKSNGLPTFKTPNDFRIKNFINDNATLEKLGLTSEDLKQINHSKTDKILLIEQDSEEKEFYVIDDKLIIRVPKKSYRPINVFKIFMKIALSLIHQEELKGYKSMFNLLGNDFEIKDEYEYSQPCSLNIIELQTLKPIFDYPQAFLYKKKLNSNLIIPDKTLVIFLGNKMYQVPILSDENFIEFKNNEAIDLLNTSPFLNPFLSKEMFEEKWFCNLLENFKNEEVNLYRSKIVRKEEEFKSFHITDSMLIES